MRTLFIEQGSSVYPFMFFSNDLVIIKDQLILISYENVRLKEKGPKLKKALTWVACHEFRKKCILILKL